MSASPLPPADPWSSELPMKTIGRYQILATLGRGAMGEVFKGRDEALDRVVAIKVIRDVSAGAKSVERFQREARAAARLSHPNIITVYEFGEHEGFPFIAMEYLDGGDLGDLLERCDLPIEQQVEIMRQAATGLHFAHQRGIIHRDVKPANIAVLQDGTVKIMDFGIAKLGDSKLTQTGSVMGTVRYMAPEQIQGLDLDGRADLFSLGVTFYEMVTKHKAFDGDSMTNVIYNVLHQDPKPIRTLDGTPHEWLQSVIHCCLEKDRDDRWPDCQAFAEALERRQPATVASARAAVHEAASTTGPRAAVGTSGQHDATRVLRADAPTELTVVSPHRAGGRRGRLAAAIGVAIVAVVVGGGLWLARPSQRARLVASAEGARKEGRLLEARDLLVEAQQAGGSPEELARARVLYSQLSADLRAAGDPVAAKAVLDQVVAWGGSSAESEAEYGRLAEDLARVGLPDDAPPFVAALEASVDAYRAAVGARYDAAADYPLVSASFELGNALAAAGAESRSSPHVREQIHDLARKLFLFVDEYEPGFNAFERANEARLRRAEQAGIARALDAFKSEVDALVAEAERLEKDPDTQLEAIGSYRAVLGKVAGSPELQEHVGLDSYRTLAEGAVARLEESLRAARQRMSLDAQTAALTTQAERLEAEGRLAEARRLHGEILDLDASHAGARAKVVELDATLRRLLDLRKAVEAALDAGRLDVASRTLAEAAALAPASPDLSALAGRLKKLEAARQEAAEGAAMLGEAAALRAAGRAGEAERRYLEISASTNDDDVRRQADEAVRTLRVERQRAEIQPLVDRAQRLERDGDARGALEAWQQVERLSSAWPGLQEQLQRLRRVVAKAEIDSKAAALRTALGRPSPDTAELKRLRAELAKLDSGHQLVRAAERTERELGLVREARAAADRLDADAALAAAAALAGSEVAGAADARSAAAAVGRRRSEATTRLQKAEAALAGGRAEEAAREARAAADAWPPLRGAADALVARADAAARAEPVAARAEPAAAAAPPAPKPAVAAPPPASATAPGGGAGAVTALLEAYSAAIRAADVDALQRLWPGLTGKQLKGIRDSTKFTKSHEVGLDVLSLDVQGDRAVVVCDRRDRLETRDGQVVENRSRATFRLRAGNGSWLIEEIE